MGLVWLPGKGDVVTVMVGVEAPCFCPLCSAHSDHTRVGVEAVVARVLLDGLLVGSKSLDGWAKLYAGYLMEVFTVVVDPGFDRDAVAAAAVRAIVSATGLEWSAPVSWAAEAASLIVDGLAGMLRFDREPAA